MWIVIIRGGYVSVCEGEGLKHEKSEILAITYREIMGDAIRQNAQGATQSCKNVQ